jgi:glutathione synthase
MQAATTLSNTHRALNSPSAAMGSTSTTMSLPEWPPAITDHHRTELARLATTYALAHGLLYLPPLAQDAQQQPRIPPSAIHAPVSLFPTPFPRTLFQRAQKLQRLYNVLYARIALDVDFLDRVLGGEQGLGNVDEYTGNLWKCWKTVRSVGFEQASNLEI